MQGREIPPPTQIFPAQDNYMYSQDSVIFPYMQYRHS